jgi:hypothetical protein
MTTSIYTIDGPLPRLVRSRWISTLKKHKKNEERERENFGTNMKRKTRIKEEKRVCK